LLSATPTAHAAPGTPPPGYAKILTLTLSGYAGGSTLTDFPALVQLDTGITDFSYSDFLSGNNDIRFTDAGGAELPYEIDTWNTGGNSLLWVKVPSVSAANTVIKMYYGKSGDSAPAYTTDGTTWTNAFRAVWHLNATSAPDSSGHGHSGTVENGTVTTTASAQIGTGGDFTSGGDISVPGSTDFTFTGDFTWSAWGLRARRQRSPFPGKLEPRLLLGNRRPRLHVDSDNARHVGPRHGQHRLCAQLVALLDGHAQRHPRILHCRWCPDLYLDSWRKHPLWNPQCAQNWQRS